VKARSGRMVLLIKLLISAAMLAVLFGRLADLRTVVDGFAALIPTRYWSIAVALLLIIANWGIEAIKWQFLVQKIYRPSFFDTLQFVFTGVTIGFITPGRSGEFAGRMILMPEWVRLKSLALSFLGGIAQVIPIAMSALLFVFLSAFNPLGKIADAVLLSLTLLIFILLFLGVDFWIKRPKIRRLFAHIELVPEQLPSFSTKWMILILAYLRFFIFVIQYLLVLYAIGLSPFDTLAPVVWMLLLQSLSPAVAILDMGVRGSIAFWVFTQYGLYAPEVLSAVFLIWFFNLCIPALAGYFFILKWKNTNPENAIYASHKS